MQNKQNFIRYGFIPCHMAEFPPAYHLNPDRFWEMEMNLFFLSHALINNPIAGAHFYVCMTEPLSALFSLPTVNRIREARAGIDEPL